MKHYIIRKDGIVQSYYFKYEKKFRARYERVPRRRVYQRRFGKRIRVWKRKRRVVSRNYALTFVLAFATRAGANPFTRDHWVDSSFEIWVEGLVLTSVPTEKFLERFCLKLLEPYLRNSEKQGWVFALKLTSPGKGKVIGDYWGVEIETSTRKPGIVQTSKLFRTTDGDYVEIKNCRIKGIVM